MPSPDWSAPTASGPLHARVVLPGSKSLTNRYLVLAALAGDVSRLRAPLRSRDTLLMAGALRAEATLAAANLVYLLLLAAGAVVVPASAYGGFGHVAQWLPSGALGEAMRDAFLDGTLAWRDLLVLLGWAVAGTAATTRTFSWE